MYVGKLVFAQVMEHLPLHAFRRIVNRYAGERKVKSFFNSMGRTGTLATRLNRSYRRVDYCRLCPARPADGRKT